MPEDLQYVTEKELCSMLNVSRSTLSRMREAGRIPPGILLGRLRRWSIATIRQWMKETQEQCAEAVA